MIDPVNRRWVLRRRPEALVGAEDFEFQVSAMPTLQTGAALVRTLFLSVSG